MKALGQNGSYDEETDICWLKNSTSDLGFTGIGGLTNIKRVLRQAIVSYFFVRFLRFFWIKF